MKLALHLDEIQIYSQKLFYILIVSVGLSNLNRSTSFNMSKKQYINYLIKVLI